MSKLRTILNRPRSLLMKPLILSSKSMWCDTSDMYIKLMFLIKEGEWLNLEQPRTFNEKLNWLKNNYRKPLFTQMVDKYEVKSLVSNMIGEGYIVPCYGVWDKFEDIDFNKLPESFVLKTTNDSSGTIVCKDKRGLNLEFCKNRLSRSLHQNYYYSFREWPYKDVKPRIIADKLLDDGTGEVLRDYKFWCFEGKPTYMYFTVKNDDIYENFYDMDFKPVAINHRFKRAVPEFDKPECFEEMKELASKLSADIPFVRVDFFQVAGKVYFGEFTFYDWGAMRRFSTKKQDFELGELIDIEKVRNK